MKKVKNEKKIENKVEKKKFFKNKIQMIIYLILFIVFIYGFVYLGTKDYSTDEADNIKFAREHNITEDNVFKYVNAHEVLNYIKQDNIVLFIGINDSTWFNKYADILNSVAKDLNINEIYYYDIEDDKENNNATYESVVDYLKDYVRYLDNIHGDLYAPTLIIKKDGVMIYYDDDLSMVRGTISAEKYFNEFNTGSLKNTITTVLKDYVESEDGKE